MAAGLEFRVRQCLSQGRIQGVGLACGRNGLQPGLDSYLGNLHMPLRAKSNAGARCSAHMAGYAFHPLLGLRAQRLGDSHLSGGELHFHGQPPLLVLQFNFAWSVVDSSLEASNRLQDHVPFAAACRIK
jgi:hypothetical protein